MLSFNEQKQLIGMKWGCIDNNLQLHLLINSNYDKDLDILDLTNYLSIPITKTNDEGPGFFINDNSVIYSPIDTELDCQVYLEEHYPTILNDLLSLKGEEFNHLNISLCFPYLNDDDIIITEDVKKYPYSSKLYRQYQCYYNLLESYIFTIIVNYDTWVIEDVY